MKSKISKLIKKSESLLLFLTLLFLPTQLGKHFWPHFSYIYSLKIDYLSPTLYFWDVLVIGLLVTWLWQKPKINRRALNLLLFFLFTQILSLTGTSNTGAGLVRLEQYGLVGLWGVFLASNNFNSLRKKIYLPIILGTAGVSLLAILQFIKGSTLGLWILGERSFTISTPGIAKLDLYGWEFLRPYATFPHPNVLAGYLLISIVILNIFYRHPERLVEGSSKLGRFLSASWRIGMTISGITIFLTMSRTAILAAVLSVIFLVRRKWLIWIGVLLLILSPILITRYFSILSFDNLTLVRREELIDSAWQVFLKFPIFGVGLNNFIPAVAGDLLTGPSRFLQPVHNIVLLALSETGLTGLIGLISLIGFPIYRLFKLYPIPYTLYPILPWFIIIFLGLFDHYFLTLPQGYRLLFLVWGLSFSMLELPNASDS